MGNPNVVGVTVIQGKTDVLSATTSATAITTCPTDKVLKINSVVVANTNGSAAIDITVELFRASTAYKIASTISVPANSTLVVVSKDMGFYLQDTDVIRCFASASTGLTVFCSYEEIDGPTVT
jgi:hypothetical protein